MSAVVIPSRISPIAALAARKIIEFARVTLSKADLYLGHEQPFRAPRAWRDDGHEYGLRSELIILHEGDDLELFLSYDREQYKLIDLMDRHLRSLGVYTEQCTRTYSALYRSD